MRAFYCGVLVDGVSDLPVDDAVVVVEDGHVVDIGPTDAVSVPGGAEKVDHADSVVIPGLIDAHLHLGGWRTMDERDWLLEDESLGAARATADLERLLAAGFTTVRDVGSRTGVGLRDAVAEGSVPGPRVFTAGLGIAQTGGFSDPDSLPTEWARDRGNGIATPADGPDGCRRAARERLRRHVDLIKIWTSGGAFSERAPPERTEFTAPEVRAITEEAHRAGIPVASHAQGAEGISLAVENGVDTIEHGTYLDAECCRRLLETDTTYVPTLSLLHRYANQGSDLGIDEGTRETCAEVLEDRIDAARRATRAGVPVALGTDFCGPEVGPHGENALEAELLVEAVGMDELDAIGAATRVAARTVPEDRVGSIEPDAFADLVVLGGDPVDDISALREVEAVYRSGTRVV